MRNIIYSFIWLLYPLILQNLIATTRLNTRKSRRSPESIDSKIVFGDEDPSVIVGEPILPHDDFVVVNQKLNDSSWSWSNEYGLISCLYKKPGIRKSKGKRLNVDYFTEEDCWNK